MKNNKIVMEPTTKHYTININTNYQIKLEQSLNTHKYYDVKWPMNEQLEKSLV